MIPSAVTNGDGRTTYHIPPAANGINCLACRTFHTIGSCPLKKAGVEHCNLCGMAHFGHARICPHIQSETQVSRLPSAMYGRLGLG